LFLDLSPHHWPLLSEGSEGINCTHDFTVSGFCAPSAPAPIRFVSQPVRPVIPPSTITHPTTLRVAVNEERTLMNIYATEYSTPEFFHFIVDWLHGRVTTFPTTRCSSADSVAPSDQRLVATILLPRDEAKAASFVDFFAPEVLLFSTLSSSSATLITVLMSLYRVFTPPSHPLFTLVTDCHTGPGFTKLA
jgi:hypothetical protein